jgi:hypothetical protein
MKWYHCCRIDPPMLSEEAAGASARPATPSAARRHANALEDLLSAPLGADM